MAGEDNEQSGLGTLWRGYPQNGAGRSGFQRLSQTESDDHEYD